MKLGILTFHDANNYGAVLQAYALQEVIKSLGYNVEIIDYKQDYIINNYKAIRVDFSGVMKFIRSVASTILHYSELSKREKLFRKFREANFNISDEYYNLNDINGYDVYISGSDQVWNPQVTNFDAAFFLNFADNNSTKISYAASIGREELSKKERGFIETQIDNMDAISVRERSAKVILEKMTKKKIERVLDPTLLLDGVMWNKFTSNRIINDQYILVYSVGPIGNIMSITEKIKRKLGLKVYCIDGKKLKGKSDYINLKNVSPQDFLALIKHATLVITNSFHGTVFSIIFNKNFITIPHKETGARMVELLNLLNLNDRITTEEDEINNNFQFEINYSSINYKLDNEKRSSLNYLKNAIQIKKD